MDDTQFLVPIEQVLDDMYSEGYASGSARDYYFLHYATEEEQQAMILEDVKQNRAVKIFWLSYLAIIIIAAVLVFMK